MTKLTMSSKLTLFLVTLTGCAVSYPAGWAGRARTPEVVAATPGVMYGRAPLRWDVAGGDRIHIDVRDAAVASGMGLYRQEIRFTATYASAPDARIVCETEPSGPGVPRTRFGCWSEAGGGEPIRFWMAPGADCQMRDGAVVDTLTTPECWHGELAVPGEQIRLRHGHLQSTGSPVGYVSWVDDGGGMLLAADIVSEMRVELFDPQPARPVAAALRRRLVLLTVALSWWEHASSPG
jgi:hypothetical protein